jgi:hypothetical protein
MLQTGAGLHNHEFLCRICVGSMCSDALLASGEVDCGMFNTAEAAEIECRLVPTSLIGPSTSSVGTLLLSVASVAPQSSQVSSSRVAEGAFAVRIDQVVWTTEADYADIIHDTVVKGTVVSGNYDPVSNSLSGTVHHNEPLSSVLSYRVKFEAIQHGGVMLLALEFSHANGSNESTAGFAELNVTDYMGVAFGSREVSVRIVSGTHEDADAVTVGVVVMTLSGSSSPTTIVSASPIASGVVTCKPLRLKCRDTLDTDSAVYAVLQLFDVGFIPLSQ